MLEDPGYHLSVLNPGGNDKEQLFAHGAGEPDDSVHAPVNFHAYAACTNGWFCSSLKTVPSSGAVLVLLRADLKASLKAVESLTRDGRKVIISWKEAGLVQVTNQLMRSGVLKRFESLCQMAAGCLAVTPELVEIYQGAGAKKTAWIPTPYPVGDPRWDFSIPTEKRNGVFIGTRELDIPSRNLATTLIAARRFGKRVTVVNTEGWLVRRKLRAFGGADLKVVKGPLPYSKYLKLMATHQIVYQLDRTTVPGQVAGDAILCGLPCVGGDGAVDRAIFPKMPDPMRLLEEPEYYRKQVADGMSRAGALLSFETVRHRLYGFLAE